MKNIYNYKLIFIFIILIIILFQFCKIQSLIKEKERYEITLNVLIKESYGNLINISDELLPMLTKFLENKHFTEKEFAVARDLIKDFSDHFYTLSTSTETYINRYNLDYTTDEPFSIIANRLQRESYGIIKTNFYKKTKEGYVIPDEKIEKFHLIINLLTNIKDKKSTIINMTTVNPNTNVIKNNQWIQLYEEIIKNVY